MEETPRGLEVVTRYFTAFSNEQLEQLSALEGLFREWNGKINVISRKDIDGLYEKHVLHSLSIAAVFDFPPGHRILDIGTGGGFPGIPLAIFFPQAEFELVDSIGKKIKVVEAVVRALNLKNVHASHRRAEEMPSRQFDCVVSRAVAPIKELWNWTKPLLKKSTITFYESVKRPVPNGLICLKGGDLAAEIAESGCQPGIQDIHQLFPEDYFKEKYILFIS